MRFRFKARSLTALQLQKYLKLEQKGKVIAEYIWIDGSNGIRSKCKVSFIFVFWLLLLLFPRGGLRSELMHAPIGWAFAFSASALSGHVRDKKRLPLHAMPPPTTIKEEEPIADPPSL